MITRATTVASCLILALSGCGDDGGSPTAPGTPLLIQAFSTATQTEAVGARVQMRSHVMSGLSELTQASQSGSARAQVCLSGSCVDAPLTMGAAEPGCGGVQTVAIGGTRLGMSVSWLGGDVVGVDFCVQDVTAAQAYETRVFNGSVQSNIVRTVCTPAGAILFCASQ